MKAKIITINSLSKTIIELKKNAKTIVHCHGVFDLLHIGHIKYLEEAKKLGDILVVTLTQDKYVNKGPGRPVFTQELRAESLSALSCVDYVSINQWPTAIETIKKIQPNYYVKGPDYQHHETDLTGNILLEKEMVESIGGVIVYTDTPLYSSSTLLNDHFNTVSSEQRTMIDHIKATYSKEDILSYFNKISSLSVLTIGEAIIDEYIFCNTLGKSGKEPILMSQEVENTLYAGGAIAVANSTSKLCKDSTLYTYLGESNDYLSFIKKNLTSNTSLKFINKENSPTIVKKRFIEKYNQAKLFGTYQINDTFLSSDQEKTACNWIKSHISSFDCVIVADYGHGLITEKLSSLIMKESPFLCVNIQQNAGNIGYHTVSKFKSSNVICIHEGELRQEYRNKIDSIEILIKNLAKTNSYSTIIVTQGAKGAIAYHKGSFTQCPAFTNNVVDRVGSGDVFLSICSLCLSVNMPLDLTLWFSNLAGCYSVSHMGTGSLLPKEYLLKSMESLLK